MLFCLFFFLIMQPFINPQWAMAALWVFGCWAFVMVDFKLPKHLLRLLLIPALLILIGLINAAGHPPYNIVKDLYYFTFPVTCVFAGGMLGRRYARPQPVLKVFAFAGIALALWQIVDVAIHGRATTDVNVLREETSNGYSAAVIAFLILFLAARFGLPLFKRQSRVVRRAVYLVLLAGIALAFSRTLTVDLVLGLVTGLGWITGKKYRGAVVIALLLLVLMNLSSFIPVNDTSFLGKLAGARAELTFTAFSGRADAIQHWRSYESFMALQTYGAATALEKAVGLGFGQLVDIGFKVDLGGTVMREIPIFHNGYVYALIKTGYIGLFFLLWYLVRFYIAGARACTSAMPDMRLLGGLMMAMTTVILSSTLVIAGWFNPNAMCPVLLLIGFLASQLRPVPRSFGAPAWSAFHQPIQLTFAERRS